MSEQTAQSHRDQQDALWSRLVRTRTCVEYCYERTSHLIDRKDALARQAFYRAGVVMGRDAEVARGVARLMRRFGGYEGAQAWLEGPPAIPPIWTATPSLDQIGFVYTARVVKYPHVLKIGFSAHPERRMRELEYAFGEEFALENYEVGTPLDEARAHADAWARYIRREFVFDPGFDDVRPGSIPDFLLSAAERKCVSEISKHSQRSPSSGEAAE